VVGLPVVRAKKEGIAVVPAAPEVGRAQLGEFRAMACEKCGAKHGAKTDKGYVQLTANRAFRGRKDRILCQGCAFTFAAAVLKGPHSAIKKQTGDEPKLF
jgi:hypothetical protein